MLARLGVSESLSQSEVNDIDVVLALVSSYQQIVWLDISVNEQPRVDVLNPLDHLIG